MQSSKGHQCRNVKPPTSTPQAKGRNVVLLKSTIKPPSKPCQSLQMQQTTKWSKPSKTSTKHHLQVWKPSKSSKHQPRTSAPQFKSSKLPNPSGAKSPQHEPTNVTFKYGNVTKTSSKVLQMQQAKTKYPLQVTKLNQILQGNVQTLAQRQVFTKGSKPRQKHQKKGSALLLLLSQALAHLYKRVQGLANILQEIAKLLEVRMKRERCIYRVPRVEQASAIVRRGSRDVQARVYVD